MRSGMKPKKMVAKNTFLKFYFTVGSFIIFLFLFFYTNSLFRSIKKEVQIVPDLYSKFIGLPADVNLESFLLQYFMTEIIPQINYPIILTDSLDTPYSWENIEIEKKDFNELNEKEKTLLLQKIKTYREQGAMIPLRVNLESDEILSYVYYGESKIMTQLRYLPYLELVMVGLFVILGIYFLMSVKRNQENNLWIGLAKETAHQFGSPLSALMGWRDIIEMKLDNDKIDPDIIKVLSYIKSDMERLNRIAARFGKVGSTIKLQDCNLHNLIEETIEYFQRILPSISKKIEIRFISKIAGYSIKIDPDLIKWSLENLIKNSLDAMQGNGGEITITAFSYNKQTYIQIRDNGKGIPKSMYKRIFYPGVTTKQRGWGLGLSLARRIVEEFHKGRIHVLASEINQGTTLEIILPEE
ncbi:MAG: ATP-binding protein [Candidatus Cloacimonetes bacterium]|nr:ATP-binding protein [Candidatus Cloacimonadota bacterium]